jgi:hypothetical protein
MRDRQLHAAGFAGTFQRIGNISIGLLEGYFFGLVVGQVASTLASTVLVPTTCVGRTLV